MSQTYTRIDTNKVRHRAGALRGYIRAAITRRKTQIRYSIMGRCALVHGAIKERRDNVNDENRDVRADGDELWFYYGIYISAFYHLRVI